MIQDEKTGAPDPIKNQKAFINTIKRTHLHLGNCMSARGVETEMLTQARLYGAEAACVPKAT